MSKRFVIESNGIWDDGKQLSWTELCDILNKLDELCDEKLDEYEYITEIIAEIIFNQADKICNELVKEYDIKDR